MGENTEGADTGAACEGAARSVSAGPTSRTESSVVVDPDPGATAGAESQTTTGLDPGPGMKHVPDTTVSSKTYLYIRIGMMAIVCILTLSIVWEWQEAGCLQTSISAYYFTPVQAIFVGSLMAISFGLIAIKGEGWEDVALNFAGLLAPIVAVIPTTQVNPGCSSVPPSTLCPVVPREVGAGDTDSIVEQFGPAIQVDCGEVAQLDPTQRQLAEWVQAHAANNLGALAIVAFILLIVAGILLRRPGSGQLTWGAAKRGEGLWPYLGTVVVLAGLTAILFLTWDNFLARAHGWSAAAMFVFLALAILTQALRRLQRVQDDRGEPVRIAPFFGTAYLLIFLAMPVAAAVIIYLNDEHEVLVLEGAELLLFFVFWLVQTVELGGKAPAT